MGAEMVSARGILQQAPIWVCRILRCLEIRKVATRTKVSWQLVAFPLARSPCGIPLRP